MGSSTRPSRTPHGYPASRASGRAPWFSASLPKTRRASGATLSRTAFSGARSTERRRAPESSARDDAIAGQALGDCLRDDRGPLSVEVRVITLEVEARRLAA